MNKMVRSCAIALGLAFVAGSASAVPHKFDWNQVNGGDMSASTNWVDQGESSKLSEDTYRIVKTQSGDLTLSSDFAVPRFDFGYSTLKVEGTMNLGADKTLSCDKFYVIKGSAGRLTSGTICFTNSIRIGEVSGGDNDMYTSFVLDGPDAKFVSATNGVAVIGSTTGANNHFEVRNGAQFIAPLSIGRVGGSDVATGNYFLASGEGTLVDVSADNTSIGALSWDENSMTADNHLTLTDGAKMIAKNVYIGSSDALHGGSNNVFTIANGATLEMPNGVLYVSRNGHPGNMLVVSNATLDATNFEIYHPASYMNATICLAGTNTFCYFHSRKQTFPSTQKLILDVTGPNAQSMMAQAPQFTFEEGSKLVITSSKDLSDVDDFEVVTLATFSDPLDPIPEGVLEIDPNCGLEVDMTTDPTKLIVRHKKAEKKTGTCIFIR